MKFHLTGISFNSKQGSKASKARGVIECERIRKKKKK